MVSVNPDTFSKLLLTLVLAFSSEFRQKKPDIQQVCPITDQCPSLSCPALPDLEPIEGKLESIEAKVKANTEFGVGIAVAGIIGGFGAGAISAHCWHGCKRRTEPEGEPRRRRVGRLEARA